jgi:hypothetical protein
VSPWEVVDLQTVEEGVISVIKSQKEGVEKEIGELQSLIFDGLEVEEPVVQEKDMKPSDFLMRKIAKYIPQPESDSDDSNINEGGLKVLSTSDEKGLRVISTGDGIMAPSPKNPDKEQQKILEEILAKARVG